MTAPGLLSPRLPDTGGDVDALCAFLHDCLVDWIEAQMTRRIPAGAILDRLHGHGLVSASREGMQVTILMNGIEGSAPSLHGALRDWIAQARAQRHPAPERTGS